MSNRSRAAYYSQLERVYSNCEECRAKGAREAKDGRRLCKTCRDTARTQEKMDAYSAQSEREYVQQKDGPK